MKKMTLIVSERERSKFIFRLQLAGVLHIKAVNEPVHHEIHFLEEKLSKIKKTLHILNPYSVDGNKEENCINERIILEKADKIQEAYQEKETLLQETRQIRNKMLWFDVWGEFDPEEVSLLEQKGVALRLYKLKKNELKRLGKTEKYSILRKEKGYVYIVRATLKLNEEFPFEPVGLPDMGPKKIQREISERQKRIQEIENNLKEEAKNYYHIKKCRQKLEKEHYRLKVKFGMKEEGEFSYLEGYCPVNAVNKVTAMAERHGMGYIVAEPDNPEEVPTLITNPAWLRIINPVFHFMNTIPGYNEFDISFFFLIFFSLFFAMLIGDAGYGILFLIVTFIARRKLKHAPREPFFLMYVLSFGTIIWGAVTGTWFGALQIAKLPFLNSIVIGKISSFAADNQNFMIFICFVIGVIQLTVAHLLRAVRVINSLKALAEIGWIFILWCMFFAAGKFVIGNAFPAYGIIFLGTGVSLVLFFTNLEKGLIKGAFITLANLPLSVISSFSDIVSYLRLFAVGYASVVVAESFNAMALSGGVNSVVSAIGAAFILFFGHALNIILGFMAVIVHGIRLNMLEFSGHLGMQWSGKEYEPFRE
ncbi:MAG: hypothetical protein ABIH85_03470 [Candidatus Omnitrophota bacterium]|nr:hypothetical protein [Candidatus Omnitrophota bacterium]MBU1894186.1 hypothetical protein [Candidatus Omnitrophota bacterium]